MQATSVHRLLALSTSAAALMPSATVQADAYVIPYNSAKEATAYLRTETLHAPTQLSRKALFEKRRLLRESQKDAEADQVRNMLMILAVLRTQQHPSALHLVTVEK